jgi:hypothetical protein
MDYWEKFHSETFKFGMILLIIGIGSLFPVIEIIIGASIILGLIIHDLFFRGK